MKLSKFNRKHGIYNAFNLLNLLQIPVHLSFVSVINRYAFNFDEHPEMTTGGLLWFKDLSEPDPYFIIPVVSELMMWLSMAVFRVTLSTDLECLPQRAEVG